jgi:CRP-like cAMP-binding protein
LATPGRCLGELNDRPAELSTRAAEQRVASAVLRMASQTGRKVAGGIQIAFRVTRATIAEMTGTTLHTLGRCPAVRERDGLVETRRGHILVTQRHKLVLLSGALG